MSPFFVSSYLFSFINFQILLMFKDIDSSVAFVLACGAFGAFDHFYEFGSVNAFGDGIVSDSFDASGCEVFVVVSGACGIGAAYEFEDVACFLGFFDECIEVDFLCRDDVGGVFVEEDAIEIVVVFRCCDWCISRDLDGRFCAGIVCSGDYGCRGFGFLDSGDCGYSFFLVGSCISGVVDHAICSGAIFIGAAEAVGYAPAMKPL